MQHCIGRAAKGHVNGHGIFKGLWRGNVPRSDIVVQQVHDRHASMLGKPDAGCCNSRNSAIARQTETDGLGKAVHGIGGEHAGTGTAARTGGILQFT